MFFLSPCSGLVVTSYSKYDPTRKLEKKIYSSIIQYKKFKKMYELTWAFRGKYRNAAGVKFTNNISNRLFCEA